MEDSLLRSVSGNASANQKTSTSTIPQNLDRIVKNQFVLKHVVLLFTPVLVMLGSMVIALILYYYGRFTIENDFVTYVVLTTLTCFFLMAMISISLYEELDQQLLSPLHEIIFTARAINNGSINHIIDSDAPQGLDSITRAFQSMQYNLNNSIKQHENVEKRKQILYAGIAHDLRTPLTSIIGYSEALSAGIANTPEKKRRYIQAISTQADVLLHLVDQLSIYNKLSARKATFPLYKVNLESLIRSYLDIEGDSLLTKHVHVKTKLKSNIYVMANTDEFQRILTNFFTNSIKYRKLPESNVVISLCRNPDDEEEAILSYHDDGPGVEESKLEKIFEPFYRTSEARTKTSNGSGLGLAVVAEIVSIHKGRIQALNDNGLLIKIYLPILKSKEIIK
ncbi:sensor histidine kinase [Allisonella histaminiformans]|uniref:histidine kinase n=1 Tax=Allisonella histaminiformans TaxID=209880 RepID=A0A1G5VEP5_9FIRM|nr:HAMP domain-containing sensor histidine kinase [Allisonella histaminiformans]MDD6869904.1 HAMP domain-containing sensor histidine kinase [Allisonella histaminiformans]SDA44244.1 Signal transduction histidine kinase [Allisonella histaminiformans]